ncbi:molybdenum cofactor guanylyltransferase [Cohnella hongkongensis]|uniref:Probable molybdenum cofactor guanylyltransferase n=1 Tax=Cohnella hongkongensis TaxID=178337 RepID=A0ABV9F9N3_9BACL
MRQGELTTVILAGGEGRRMGGRNKALLTLGRETIIERQLREAAKLSTDVVVVANDARFSEQLAAAYPGVRIVSDAYAGEGPLAGVHAGFREARSPHVWLLGCDQPYPSASAAEYLLRLLSVEQAQAAVPLIGGNLQPFHAVYRQETGAIAEERLLAGSRRLLHWLERLERREVGADELLAAGHSTDLAEDIDTPEQYEDAIARWAARPLHPQQRS